VFKALDAPMPAWYFSCSGGRGTDGGKEGTESYGALVGETSLLSQTEQWMMSVPASRSSSPPKVESR